MSEHSSQVFARNLLRDDPSISQDLTEQHRRIDLTRHLMALAQNAVSELNNNVGGILLTFASLPSGIHFIYREVASLYMEVDAYMVTLHPESAIASNPSATKYLAHLQDGVYTFKAVPVHPTLPPTFEMSDENFVRNVLKVACNKHFDSN